MSTEADQPALAAPDDPSPRDKSKGLLRLLVFMALPVLAEHTLHIAVGVNDTYLANHLPADQAAAAAAVGTVQYFFWFLGLFSGAIGTGSTAIIARASGARHRSRANSACGQSILFALIFGCLVGATLYLAAVPISHMTGLEGKARAMALDYIKMLAPAAPFLIVMFVANACLRGAGDTLTPGIAMIVVDGVNIFFSWGLTFGKWGLPNWGFDGIAIGTVVAYIAGGVLQVFVLLVGRGGIRLHLHRLRPHWNELRRLLRIGLPTGGEQAINWVANFALLIIVNRTAPVDVAAAAHAVTIRIESFSYMTGFAVAVAATTLVGQSLGMKDPARARRAANLAFALGGGFMTLCGVMFILFGRFPASWMSEDPQIRELATQCLFVTGFCQPFFAAAIVYGGALRGAGDTLWVMISGTLCILLLRLGGVLLIGWHWHQPLTIIWVVLAVELSIRGSLMFLRFRHGAWQRVVV